MPVVSAIESLSLDFQRDAPPSSASAASGERVSSNTNPAPPSPFLRPRRFAPLHTPLCLLRPLIAQRPGSSQPPILGFESFQVLPRSPATPSPRLAMFGPFRVFPSPSAVSRHRDPCLPAVFSSPYACVSTAHDGWEGSTSRLSSSDESVVQARVAACLNPILSWASFPSKVFSGASARGGDLRDRAPRFTSITGDFTPGDRTVPHGQPSLR